jgi:N6-adenosine-specific RNA methylase IME4
MTVDKEGKKYQIIYADPPWQYKSKECLSKTSILNGKLNTHYPTMTMKDIKELLVGGVADDNCLLFLWVVSPMLDDCIDVLKSWGFKYSTIGFVWYKQKTNPGSYTMSECEICLIGKKGSIPTPRGARNIRQFLSEKKTKHSSKPLEIKDRITQMFPTQNKLELFAREKTDGWDVWGNEVESDIQL